MKMPTLSWVAIGLAAGLLVIRTDMVDVKLPDIGWPSMPVFGPQAPDIPPPADPALKQAVQPITNAFGPGTEQDAMRCAGVLLALADTVERSTQQVVNKSQLRELAIAASTNALDGTPSWGKYPVINTVCDDLLRKRVGVDMQPPELTPQTRQAAADIYRAAAWACMQSI